MNKFRRAVVSILLKRILNILCKIDSNEFVEALRAAHSSGYHVLLAVNHINFLEVPILVSYSYPLLLTGLVKAETWKNPLMAFLSDTYEAIPINRSGSFSESFKQVHKALENGFSVCIAPEGTRSKTGILGRGKAGIVQLALETGAFIMPVVHFGGEHVWNNIRHFKRTSFQFKVGRPFRFSVERQHVNKEVRECMLEELMRQMAILLPENMQGIYAETANKEYKYLEFIDWNMLSNRSPLDKAG
ncbi:MAG: 1-acyl-sn-glycerol-3-phosphate acyltransferase [Treponema sp.]|jgi:1-acyl-sn-glycerol-3-phosphate acyltransferase|nr:1-acyl-sn-glycerol-3-phosphate acyltransferase [Treponema sp.]